MDQGRIICDVCAQSSKSSPGAGCDAGIYSASPGITDIGGAIISGESTTTSMSTSTGGNHRRGDIATGGTGGIGKRNKRQWRRTKKQHRRLTGRPVLPMQRVLSSSIPCCGYQRITRIRKAVYDTTHHWLSYHTQLIARNATRSSVPAAARAAGNCWSYRYAGPRATNHGWHASGPARDMPARH